MVVSQSLSFIPAVDWESQGVKLTSFHIRLPLSSDGHHLKGWRYSYFHAQASTAPPQTRKGDSNQTSAQLCVGLLVLVGSCSAWIVQNCIVIRISRFTDTCFKHQKSINSRIQMLPCKIEKEIKPLLSRLLFLVYCYESLGALWFFVCDV